MTEWLDRPNPTLRQGDIVLAPSATLLAGGENDPVRGVPAAPPRLGQRVRGPAWRSSPAAPDTIVETWWTPVLVLSHDCHLEKDFNERVRQLMAEGVAEDDAVAQASADPSLDPFAVVAPLQPYADFPEHRHASIQAGDRIGYFPVDMLPGDGGDYVVDLGRVTTVSVMLLPQRLKVASLADAPLGELRYKLAEMYAIRDLAVIGELEAMVGHTILRAEALTKNRKKSALVLHLDNGEIVHLEIRRPREELPGEITRTAAS